MNYFDMLLAKNLGGGGGGGGDSQVNLITLHVSFEMPELPPPTVGLNVQATMYEYEGQIVLAQDSNSAFPLLVTESQTDLKCYSIPTICTIDNPPEPSYIGTRNQVVFFVEGDSGIGPYMDFENSVYTNCSWDSENWRIVFDEGFSEASVEVKFTNVQPW